MTDNTARYDAEDSAGISAGSSDAPVSARESLDEAIHGTMRSEIDGLPEAFAETMERMNRPILDAMSEQLYVIENLTMAQEALNTQKHMSIELAEKTQMLHSKADQDRAKSFDKKMRETKQVMGLYREATKLHGDKLSAKSDEPSLEFDSSNDIQRNSPRRQQYSLLKRPTTNRQSARQSAPIKPLTALPSYFPTEEPATAGGGAQVRHYTINLHGNIVGHAGMEEIAQKIEAILNDEGELNNGTVS